MNTKVVTEYLFRVYEFLVELNKPILGITITEWIKLFILYSFVIWIPIIVWNAYQDYLRFKELERQKNFLLSSQRRVEKKILKYKQKLKDMEIAYKQISQTFSEKRVQYLIENLNKEILSIKNSQKQMDSYNPISFIARNFKGSLILENKINFYIPKFFFSINGYSFTTPVLKFFQAKNLLFQNSKKIIPGEVNVSLVGKKIVLFFKPSENSILLLKPVVLLGVIKEPNKLIYIPTYGYFSPGICKNIWLTNVLFGWGFELKGEVLKNAE